MGTTDPPETVHQTVHHDLAARIVVTGPRPRNVHYRWIGDMQSTAKTTQRVVVVDEIPALRSELARDPHGLMATWGDEQLSISLH